MNLTDAIAVYRRYIGQVIPVGPDEKDGCVDGHSPGTNPACIYRPALEHLYRSGEPLEAVDEPPVWEIIEEDGWTQGKWNPVRDGHGREQRHLTRTRAKNYLNLHADKPWCMRHEQTGHAVLGPLLVSKKMQLVKGAQGLMHLIPTGVSVAEQERINHPEHYGGDTTYEAIKVIEAWDLGFCLGNTVKYISRAGKKDPLREIEDLRKSLWYLERRIQQLEQAGEARHGSTDRG